MKGLFEWFGYRNADWKRADVAFTAWQKAYEQFPLNKETGEYEMSEEEAWAMMVLTAEMIDATNRASDADEAKPAWKRWLGL